jgi:integrase
MWEKAGWISEGYSARMACGIRSERLRSIRHGDDLPKEKQKVPMFKVLAEKYLEWAKVNKSRGGIADKSRYDNHLKKRFDEKRLDEISPFALEKMKAEMAKNSIAPKTIAHCLGLIRAMYNKAEAWGLYQGLNPVKKVKLPTAQNARDRFLSFEEAETLLKELRRNHRYKNRYVELEDPVLHDMALIALHTGARASEIFNIKGQDINFNNGIITLRDTKNNETGFLFMTQAVEEILRRRALTGNGYVFTDKNGERVKEVSNAFERVVNRLRMNEGVTDSRQKVVFHSLRHTFASWLAMQGTPIYTIAQLMRHKSIAMSQRYSHLSPDHKKQAVMELEKSIKRGKKVVSLKKK